MMSVSRTLSLAALSLMLPVVGSGADQARELTLEGTLAIARVQAPEIASALTGVDEARGRLAGASVWQSENPRLDLELGPRLSERRRFALEAGISQTLELGGKRGARLDGARAGFAHAAATSDDVARHVLYEAGAAFLRALHAEAKRDLAARAEAVALQVLDVAQRRYVAGDVPVLHVNVAQAELARARASAQTESAAHKAAERDLRLVLGFGAATPLVLRGDLADRARFDALADRSPGETLAVRPDVLAAAAALAEARADERFGRSLVWPDPSLGVRYSEDEPGNRILFGTLSLSLPVFARGRGERVEATARARRLEHELETARQGAEVQARTAAAVYRDRATAADALAAALPTLDVNEVLARRSYEVGEIGLADLLVIRREIIDSRMECLDRLLEAALAGIELELQLGVLR